MTKPFAFLMTTVVLLLCGVEFGLYIQRQAAEHARFAHQDLQREVRLAQASGISLERNSVNPAIPPAAEDAEPIYSQISVELSTHPLDETPFDAVTRMGAQPTSAQIARVKDLLRQHGRLVTLIHKAAIRPRCAPPVKWDTSDPFMLSTPRLSDMRRAERVLTAESAIMAEEGHILEAIRNQTLVFHIAGHFYEGQTMIFALSGNAANSIALNGMRRILYLDGNDPAVDHAVLKAIQENAHTPDIPNILRAEATLDYAHIGYLRTRAPMDISQIQSGQAQAAVNIPWRLPQPPPTKEWRDAYLDTSEACLLQRQRLDIRASAYPYPQATVMLQANAAQWGKLGSKRTRVALAAGDDFPKFIKEHWRNTAAIRLMEVSTQILIWKSHHGEFPKTLSAIGDTPVDPFSGKPFPYRREGAGFVIYSVGELGAFDGGVPTVRPTGYQTVFRYPLPPYYRSAVKAQKTQQ